MRKKNFIRAFNRALYAGGTVFFIAGLLLLAVSSPALALQSRVPASAPNSVPADVVPSSGSDVFNGVKANARIVYQESIADASRRLMDNLFQGEQPASCPCADGNADIQNSLLAGTPCPCWTVTPPPADTPGTPSSLVVASGCNCTCETASATVCNVGGSDMIEPASWQLYANPAGAPSTGQVVASGQVGPLDSGECATLNVEPPFAGNYSYRFVQEPGAQGEPVIWTGSCTVGTECFPGEPTATATATASATSTGFTATAPGVVVTLTSTATPTPTSPSGGTATPTRTSRPPLPVNLSAVCSYVDEDTMLWKVANSTDAAIDFTWQVVGGTESGSGTVDANGSTYFETSAGDKTVQLFVEGELADTEASQPPCKQALTVSYTCTDSGLVWSITNPNSFGTDYEWSIDGGAQTGSGMIPAGQTIVVATTTEGAHTFTLTWTDDRPGEHVTVASSPADSCPDVTATPTSTDTPTITATAPGVEITLTSTPTPTNTLPVSTATFTPTATNTQPVNTATNTPTSTNTQPVNTATNTPTSTNTQPVNTATNTPTITATAPGVQITLTNTPTVTNTAPANTATNTPTVTNTVPANTATFTPTVTNTVPANTATFTPTVTNTPTITSTAPGVQITLTFTPTATQTNTLPPPTATFTPTITLTPPLTIITVSPPPTLTSQPSQNVSLNTICAYPSDTTLLWSVTNPTGAAVTFTWRVVGSTETGTGVAGANSTVFFNTSAGSKVVELLINGQVVATVSSAPPCRLPISVNYVCASPTTVNWYVTNGNNQTVPYVWTVDTNTSGNSQVGPNTTQVFATTGLGQHTVTVTWLIEPLGPRGVQLTANVATCGGVVTTPTQIVTLAPPVITSTPVIIPQTGGDFAAPALLTSLIGRLFTTIGLLLFGAAITISVVTGRWKV